MKDHKTGFAALPLVVIVLVLLGGGAYFWSQNSATFNVAQKPAITPSAPPGFTPPTTPPPSAPIPPVANPDPMANWKTYTDKDYGFEIKYPSDWHTQLVQSDILFVPPEGNTPNRGATIQVVENGMRSPSSISPLAHQIQSGNKIYYINGSPKDVLDKMISTFRFTR